MPPISKVWCVVEAVNVPDSATPASPAPIAAPPSRPTESRAEVRPCDDSGVALRAARETGTNSIPSPRPTGINGRIVTTPLRVSPGMPRISSPIPAPREAERGRQLLAAPVDEPAGPEAPPRRRARG